MNKIKQYITSVLIQAITVVNIIGLPPVFVNFEKSSSYTLYAASDGAYVLVKIKGEKVPPERITNLIAEPWLVTGVYPGDELGGRVTLTWTAPKDPEVYDVHPDTYVFSYIIKFDTSTLGYNLGYLSELWQWWDDAERVRTNHIWILPQQAQGQTFEEYPLGFGIPAPEEKFKLSYGITDKVLITGLPKGKKIYIGISARDRFYNQSTPTVVSEVYVPASVVPPSKITDLNDIASGNVLIPGQGWITLRWTSPANDRYSVDASSGEYNLHYGKYCIAYGTTPPPVELSPKELSTKWPQAQAIYIDTDTLKYQPQVFTITGLTLMEGTTAIGHYFLVWTSDEWFGKNNWSTRSNLAGWGLVAPDYVT
ncbi:MAG: hypothetical protein NZ839_03465, partial [Endomicrobia bacterium]|nr:hypothetical protein [Endomicrobiia bacterium]